MLRLLITSLILLITMNSCDKTLAKYSMNVEGKDLLITDVIYIMKETDEWDEGYTKNKNLDKIGCHNCLCALGSDVTKETIYNNKKEVIEEFCSDSYVIGCFLLEEVLKHNPSVAEDMEKNRHAFAIIRNFTGTVTFTVKEEKYYSERLPILNIRGEGNINFHSDYEPESLLEGMDD